MNGLNAQFRVSPAKREIQLATALFAVLWIYLFIRANTVFFIHDEIVTKWAYMISWNPLPFQGYIDANNHFLNSFFGGLFIRLFQSDSILVVRLGNLISFPLYFWSVFGLRHFFEKRVNFYLLLVSLTCSAFLIEYFGMARGYGMSLAFTSLALQQTLMLFRTAKYANAFVVVLAWVFAVYANLTLIPFAFAGIMYVAFYLWRKKKKNWILVVIPPFLLLGYALFYSFYLKRIGKLYYGGQDGFFDVTLGSLTPYIWSAKGPIVNSALVLISALIFFISVGRFVRWKDIFDTKQVFALFFMLSLLNIFFQNWVLGINFPEDRAALYLIIFFWGAFCFSLDVLKNQWMAYPFILLTLVLFGFQVNFNTFLFFDYEHFDRELITKLPDEVGGIPPSTGARRDWAMDNELMRTYDLPLSIFQVANAPEDTLQDYIVTTQEIRPDIINLYHPIYSDKISGLTLFERNSFRGRKMAFENNQIINGSGEYYNLYIDKLTRPLYLRCSGYFEDMNMFEDAPILVFSAEDSTTQEISYYQSLQLIQSCAIDQTGRISFDFTTAMNSYPEANQIKAYLWNPNKQNLEGEIKTEVYEIE